MDAGYYQRLYAAAKDPAFIRAVAEFLLSRDILEYDASAPAEMTKTKQQMIEGMQSDVVGTFKGAYEDYPYPLVTNVALRAMVGMDAVKSDMQFSHALEDAGWVRIARFAPERGKSVRVYCRDKDVELYGEMIPSTLREHMPTTDFGYKPVLKEV